MRIWDIEATGDVVSKTLFDEDSGRVISTIEQDADPIKSAAVEKQKDFRGYKSDVANQVASIPINLHYFWLNTEGYDFTDFDNNPWSKTVKKMRDANLEHFFTTPGGGYN